MATVKEIFDELNKNNSQKYKLSVLKKYKEHEQLKRVIKLMYDNVKYAYGVTLQNVLKTKPDDDLLPVDLDVALDVLEKELSTHYLTGNDALRSCMNLIAALNDDDAEVFKRILERDAKCGIGEELITKVWDDLLTKQVYMRCSVFNEKAKKNIKFPAYVQLKADGAYREFTVYDNKVTSKSKNGKSYEYPIHFEIMKNFPDGVYIGKLTVETDGADGTYGGIKNGSVGNGLINSLNPPHDLSHDLPHDKIIFYVWDYITIDDYIRAGNVQKIKSSGKYLIKGIKNAYKKGAITKEEYIFRLNEQRKQNAEDLAKGSPKIPYKKRFQQLEDIIKKYVGETSEYGETRGSSEPISPISPGNKKSQIRLIPSRIVNDLDGAMRQTLEWIKNGYEGSIIKNMDGFFKDGISKDQFKVNRCI